MTGKTCVPRHRGSLLLWAATAATAMLISSPASARKMNLQQLLEMARSNPGLQASAAATSAMEAQVFEAKMNWLPQGDILSLLAPSPDIQCNTPPLGSGVPPPCLTTTSPEASLRNVSWNKVFTRTELKLIQPLYDFGKISAGVAAAEAGVNVSRQREAGARADLELNIRKAYFGLKFAREVIDMLEQGSSYVDDGAKRLEKDLAAGTGNVTVTDKLRMRTVRAELDARILEAKRLQGLARESLRTLLGPEAPSDVDIDDDPFEPPEIKERAVSYYEDLARVGRPEVRMLEYAVKAKSALADLERRSEYPDLVLIATAAFARAQTVDDPNNAFMSHYFNSTTAGVAAALRMQLDLGPKIARARKTRLRGGRDPASAKRGAGRHPAGGAQDLRRDHRGAGARRRDGEGRKGGEGVDLGGGPELRRRAGRGARSVGRAGRVLRHAHALPAGGVRSPHRAFGAGARHRLIAAVSAPRRSARPAG